MPKKKTKGQMAMKVGKMAEVAEKPVKKPNPFAKMSKKRGR